MYDFLSGIRVLDVSLLATSLVGMHLAEMGADVIKVEAPPSGDHVRDNPVRFRGNSSLSHRRWNRGKRSLALDLKTEAGRMLFLDAVDRADVVIDGLRPGSMARFGLAWDTLSQVKPSLVYCALSGFGQSGPYRSMGAHGAASDAYGALAPVEFDEEGQPFIGGHVSVGTRVAPVYAAFGICAALRRASKTGQGSFIDVAQSDVSAYSRVDDWVPFLNTGMLRPDRPFKNAARNQYYRTQDGRYLLFQPFERKFWVAFCEAVGRPDLLKLSGFGSEGGPNDTDLGFDEPQTRTALAEIFGSKPLEGWVSLLLATGIPGAPVNTIDTIGSDAHFVARDNLIVVDDTDGPVIMPTTPIKAVGESFEIGPAPQCGEHTLEVLSELLGLPAGKMLALRDAGVITFPSEERSPE
jgi:crotonobetainyl-CoA:carnitine CoA-transferase CaiB-like acyl-CoA transferase